MGHQQHNSGERITLKPYTDGCIGGAKGGGMSKRVARKGCQQGRVGGGGGGKRGKLAGLGAGQVSPTVSRTLWHKSNERGRGHERPAPKLRFKKKKKGEERTAVVAGQVADRKNWSRVGARHGRSRKGGGKGELRSKTVSVNGPWKGFFMWIGGKGGKGCRRKTGKWAREGWEGQKMHPFGFGYLG